MHHGQLRSSSASLDLLPPAIQRHILEEVPDISTLHALLRASPRYVYNATRLRFFPRTRNMHACKIHPISYQKLLANNFTLQAPRLLEDNPETPNATDKSLEQRLKAIEIEIVKINVHLDHLQRDQKEMRKDVQALRNEQSNNMQVLWKEITDLKEHMDKNHTQFLSNITVTVNNTPYYI